MRARAPGRVALCAALLTLAACQAPFPTARVVPAPGGSVVEALYGGFPGALNPPFEVEDNPRDIDSPIYQGLTAGPGDQSPPPPLPPSWSLSDKPLSYTFALD